MPGAANPDDPTSATTDDEAMLRRLATDLADGIDRVLPGWVVACVTSRVEAWRPGSSSALVDEARRAGEAAVADQGAAVRALLLADVDRQAAGPLAVLRTAVVHPTGVLHRAGVPEVVRDDFAVHAFPDDVYDLSPATFADLDPTLHEPGLVWGAAKAHVVLRRRRAR